MATQPLKFEQFVNAPPASVYHAFTNATAIREWLCDVATVDPRPGGRVYLAWNNGFYASGEFTDLKPGKSIAFTWHGRNEPKVTKIKVTLKKQDGGTLVTMAHTGISTGGKWGETIKEYQHEGPKIMANLASVLETGQDLRIVNRPMLGVNFGDFTCEQAKQLGVPVTEGLRLDYVGEGMGAHTAGLQPNDVIVGMDGRETKTWPDALGVLHKHRAGDKIEAVFYRGPERRTVMMELSRRRIPDVPFDPMELAKRVRARYDESLAELSKCFEGVSEAEASFHPAPDEWSAKEVLAHLILGDQFFPNYFAGLLMGQEQWTDDWTGNSNELTRAIVVVYPTAAELLDEQRRLAKLMVAFIESWPPEFPARKGSYFRVAWQLLEGQTHTQAHLEQIRAAIAAALPRETFERLLAEALP